VARRGTARLGETLLDIEDLALIPGGLAIVAVVHGPIAADSGFPVIYTPNGEQAWVGASRVDVPPIPAGHHIRLRYTVNMEVVTPRKKTRRGR
jgi:hypothetical protein